MPQQNIQFLLANNSLDTWKYFDPDYASLRKKEEVERNQTNIKDVNFILHYFPGRCGCRWSGEVVKNICPAAWAPQTFVQLISQNSPSSFCLCCPLIIIFVHTFLLTLKVMLQNLYRIKQEFFICINNYKQHRRAPLWQFDQLNKWTVPTMLSHVDMFTWQTWTNLTCMPKNQDQRLPSRLWK